MKIPVLVVFAALLTPLAFSQDLKPVPASGATENNILRAEHALDLIDKNLDVMSNDFLLKQQQAQNLHEQYLAELPNKAAAEKKVNDAIEAAWKESGLDKSKYDFDHTAFIFNPKPVEKAATTPPTPEPKKVTPEPKKK